MKLGLIGKKLGHSLSPEIHQYLMEKQGINGTYELIEVPEEQTSEIIPRMKEHGITGLNVTIPYKETLLPLIDVVSDDVRKIGALNTIWLCGGKTYAYNTDYIGVYAMFERAGVRLAEADITILGAGGAAKAAVYACLEAGAASVTVAVRNPKKALSLKERFDGITVCALEDITGGDILFNTTPVGMYPNTGQSVVAADVIRKFSVAADMVYNPLKTRFLQIAENEGLVTVTGLSMLVGQAVRAEEIWFQTAMEKQFAEEILKTLEGRF